MQGLATEVFSAVLVYQVTACLLRTDTAPPVSMQEGLGCQNDGFLRALNIRGRITRDTPKRTICLTTYYL